MMAAVSPRTCPLAHEKVAVILSVPRKLRGRKLLFDNRALTKTDPPTLWFIAKTNKNRFLKIVYILKNSQTILKTAYEPNETELAIYARFGAAH